MNSEKLLSARKQLTSSASFARSMAEMLADSRAKPGREHAYAEAIAARTNDASSYDAAITTLDAAQTIASDADGVLLDAIKYRSAQLCVQFNSSTDIEERDRLNKRIAHLAAIRAAIVTIQET